jgi:hypothetical protein
METEQVTMLDGGRIRVIVEGFSFTLMRGAGGKLVMVFVPSGAPVTYKQRAFAVAATRLRRN